MGYQTINAIDLLAQFETRPGDYRRIADILQAAAARSGLGHLSSIAQRMRRDSRADEMLLAMIKLDLMSRPEPLLLALFSDEGLLHDHLVFPPTTG